MNEKVSSFGKKIKSLWGKWSMLQKGIIIGVAVLAIVLIVVLMSWSSKPTLVKVFSTSITDLEARDRIIVRMNQENINPTIDGDGLIYVDDLATARRMRSILIREGLVPKNVNAWQFFDTERFSKTDTERRVEINRAMTEEIKQHIKALDDIDNVSVIVRIPEKALFQSEQDPVEASVVLYPAPGSDILSNRKKVEGIQKLIKFGISGLQDENITIADPSGNTINDFESMKDFDRLTLIEKQQKLKEKQERHYEMKILTALQRIFGDDRVRDVSIKIEMDMSERSAETRKILPTVMRYDNPETPFDDSEIIKSISVSSNNATTIYEGTGINPEGPDGVEGQTPPSYKDTSNLTGRESQTITRENYDYSYSNIKEIFSPEMGRRTVSVNIDGLWEKLRDDDGNFVIKNGKIDRKYIEVPDEELKEVVRIVYGAIGFDPARKDLVTVTNIKVDRTKEFEAEDDAYFKSLQKRKIILISLAGVSLALLLFILYRIITREIERRRRLKEEEALRQAQLERERILYEQQMANADVSMTVEERRHLELQENAINMAREHPEDVALLIRTWLMEE